MLLNIKTCVLALLLVSYPFIHFSEQVHAAEPSAGAVNNWFSLSGATKLSIDMKPIKGEAGYHFYSLSPFFHGLNYGMYTGIQTNGNLGNGVDVGNVFLFSVWNATAAYPENGSTATPFGGEGVGYSLRNKYDWSVGTAYTVALQRTSFDSAKNGWRWSSTITNKSTGSSFRIGEIVAPPGASALSTGSAFHERFQGSTPVCGSSSNLEQAGIVFSNLSSDSPVSFYGSPDRNNIFASAACASYIHTFSNSSMAVTGFGISSSEFAVFLSSSPPAPAASPAPSAVTAPTPAAPAKTNIQKTAEMPQAVTNNVNPGKTQEENTAPKRRSAYILVVVGIFLTTLSAVFAGLFLKYRKRRVQFSQNFPFLTANVPNNVQAMSANYSRGQRRR